ncbi:L-fuculose kinase [Microbulbifer sp. SH-1]|uniref:FGGY-family carbohydrate kinase n=1 Tax=Microbulbifer sp. SH-1 TaxID=2681547 RepID=UPI00140A2202|nr:FGGY family carbohydrate kinase [Microbulbifer sp. SH-1]QIL88580.1 L-fuculose kinase [Microbulbifer sp. SH-1]
MNHIAILDIGKTNIKLHLRSETGDSIKQATKPNSVSDTPPYPHYDVESIWRWILDHLGGWQIDHNITTIVITTHGATAALIDRTDPSTPLVLPVLDYEYKGVESANENYQRVRPCFSETGSPDLPAGLNLARQLYWQYSMFPNEFSKVTDILTYPQYWAWRLTGKRYSEVTSLGCHTDLWNPQKATYSSLVEAMNWTKLFPELRQATDIAGAIAPNIATATGISTDCKVYVGIHDSNASYYRYLAKKRGDEFTVVSTGTWSVAMSSHSKPSSLSESQDLLLNVDVNGSPVVCSRFMAGRETQLICDQLDGTIDEDFTVSDLQRLIDNSCFCLPSWADGTGPYPHKTGKIIGELPLNTPPAAVATLYLALMIDKQLDLISSSGPIFIEGAYQKNNLLLGILSTLRGNQELFVSKDETGTVTGAFMLAKEIDSEDVVSVKKIEAVKLRDIQLYKKKWSDHCDN